MKKKQRATIEVNYDTQWKHDYINKERYPVFKAKTPIVEIVPVLENCINGLYPDLNEDYTTSGGFFSFNRLYRNLVGNYKGWEVFYREPDSNTGYGKITEPIGYKKRQKKTSLKRTVFNKTMIWTHELHPLIEKVKIQGVKNCETIAKRLNDEVNEPNYRAFFDKFNLSLANLSNSHKDFYYKMSTDQDFKFSKNSISDQFCNYFEDVQNYYGVIHRFINKDYTLQGYNINDILQDARNVNSTKGWTVEFTQN